jgi:RNA polymerase sigma-70 factor (ECF subfamily)
MNAPVTEFSLRTEMMQYLPQMRAFARTLTGNRERADDLVQDTVIRALNAEQQFVQGTNLKAWLMTILRNHYINGLRRQKMDGGPVDMLPEALLAMPAVQEEKVETQEIGRALMTMSPEHREVLILILAVGFSYEEAAEICGCAVGTVKSRLNRARGELRRIFESGVANAQTARSQ